METTKKRIFFMALAHDNRVFAFPATRQPVYEREYPDNIVSETKAGLVKSLMGYCDTLMDYGEFKDAWELFKLMYAKIQRAR